MAVSSPRSFGARARAVLAGLVALAGLACVVAIGVSFFGWAFAPFDSVSHFRAHLCVVALAAAIVLLLARRAMIACAIALVAIAGLTTTLPWILPAPAEAPNGTGHTLLQMNLRFDAALDPAIERIEARSPDFVTLQEASRRWVDRLGDVAGRYPYRAICGREGGVGRSVVLSRWELVPGSEICRPDEGFVAARFLIDGEAMTVASVHLAWPWPHRQWRQVEALADTLASLAGPILIGGDFNAAPWSASVQSVAQASGTRTVRGIGPTFLPRALPRDWKAPFGLLIDNVLVSPDVAVISAGSLAQTGSDHLPVEVRFAVSPRS